MGRVDGRQPRPIHPVRLAAKPCEVKQQPEARVQPPAPQRKEAPVKRVLMLVLLPVLVSGLTLAGASGASAAAVIHVSGTDLGPDAGTTACQPVNDSGTLLTCTTPDFATRYTGDLTGAISSNFTWTINCTSNRIAGHGIETFTGSVATAGSGTLTWAAKFRASFDCSTQNPVEPGRLRNDHVRHRQADTTPRQTQVPRADLLRHPDPFSPRPLVTSEAGGPSGGPPASQERSGTG